jgi:hypothetical protein
MMAMTRRVRVFPLYQVEIRDADDDVDYPQWETGEERILVSAQCIVLATRSDLEGDVVIEVRVNADQDDQAAGQLLFDGELLTTGQGIVVGHSLTGLRHIQVPIGWHPVRIYADPPTDPARFTVLVDRGLPAADRWPLRASPVKTRPEGADLRPAGGVGTGRKTSPLASEPTTATATAGQSPSRERPRRRCWAPRCRCCPGAQSAAPTMESYAGLAGRVWWAARRAESSRRRRAWSQPSRAARSASSCRSGWNRKIT